MDHSWGGAALMFAVKLAENFKNFEIFVVFENILKFFQHKKVQKKF